MKDMDSVTVEVSFTAPMLGTVPLENKSLEFIRPRDLDTTHVEEEDHTAPGNHLAVNEDGEPLVEPKGRTGFHMLDDGTPIMYDYMIKGFFKDAASMLRRSNKTESAGLKAHKKVIDGCVFVEPRRIPILLPKDEGLLVVKRPLRVDTPHGSRVAIAVSEAAPEGSRIIFTVKALPRTVSEELLYEWLEYGAYRGLGQWRNAGFGAFEFQVTRA